MVLLANEQMISKITDEIITAYQNESFLGYLKGVDLGSIAVEDWYTKSIDDIPDAALSIAGFNPSEAKLNAKMTPYKVFTAAESIAILEKAWAQFQQWGIDTEGMRMLGAKIAYMASLYTWVGLDMSLAASGGKSPYTQYNYITYAGGGTLAAPSLLTTATAGVWSTAANKAFDLALLGSQLVSKGYKLESSVVFYPRIAHQSMSKRISGATYETSAIEILKGMGFRDVVALPDDYIPTAAPAAAANDLFDLYAIDLSQWEIGYTRPETARVVPPTGKDRSHYMEAEVWFCPRPIPRPWTNGTVYKGVSRITAIAP